MALRRGMVIILQVHKGVCCLRNEVLGGKKRQGLLNNPKTEA